MPNRLGPNDNSRLKVSRGLRARAPQEDGAVLAIVALSLIALFGMMILVIDVGGLLYERRMLVNGSDAAALAAARSCAMTNDMDDPETIADQYAAANVEGLPTGALNIIDHPGCDSGKSGYVTVEYVKNQQLFFAPVLGFDDSAPVRTQATAHWGGIGEVVGPMPLVLNSGALQGNCDVPDVQPGAICYLWYDNDRFSGSAFGFLDVEDGWNVGADATKCPSPGSKQLQQWINGEDPVGTLDLNYPSATYACVDGGLRGQVSTAVWGEISKLIGQTRDFPINGVSPADGGSQVMNSQGTQVDLYNIIGFAHMEIVNLLDPQEAAGTAAVDGTCTKNNSSALAIGTHPWSEFGNGNGCPGSTMLDAVDTVMLGSLQYGSDFTYNNIGLTLTKALPNHSNVSFNWHVYPVPGKCGTDPPPNSSARCLIVKWNGSTFTDDEVGDGANFGEVAVSLCDNEFNSCVQPGT